MANLQRLGLTMALDARTSIHSTNLPRGGPAISGSQSSKELPTASINSSRSTTARHSPKPGCRSLPKIALGALHKTVPDIVRQIDSIVVRVAFVGWHDDTDGDKKARRELRATLKHFGLPLTGQLFGKTYAYVREDR